MRVIEVADLKTSNSQILMHVQKFVRNVVESEMAKT
jgi:hypothetical protein